MRERGALEAREGLVNGGRRRRDGAGFMETETGRAKRRRMELQNAGSAELQVLTSESNVVENPTVVVAAMIACCRRRRC